MDKKLKNDTTIRIGDTIDNAIGNVFEYNVNMSVSLPSARRTKIFQRIQSLLIVLLILFVVFIFTQFRREVRGLEAQINSVNSNLAYRLSRIANRNNNDKRKYPKIYHDDIETIMDTRDYQQEEFMKIPKPRRYSRSIPTFDHENITSSGTSMIDGENLSKDIRVGRARRDETRGKQQRKAKRKLIGDRRRLGPLFATFVGAVPEQHITNAAYIGPWVKRNETGYGFNKFHLVEDKKSIEVTTNGLYMISVQIYYLGEASHFSYWVLMNSEGTSHTTRLTKCSTSSTVAATEASCYTSVTVPMKRGDRFHIEQQETDRLVNLQEGYSYIQVILLSSDQGKRSKI